MSSDEKPSDDSPEVDAIPWPDFLMQCPPGRKKRVRDSIQRDPRSGVDCLVAVPPIRLPCEGEQCGGVRVFQRVPTGDSLRLDPNEWGVKTAFLKYWCRNCSRTGKTYAVGFWQNGEDVSAVKIGEWPPFGPRIPSRVISLIGPDRELFLKGRRAESQGLGIGAFSYYRRVVENQKNRILDKIIDVARRTEADKEVLLKLEAAKNETQFKRSVDDVKDAIPSVLLIENHNPMKLLHNALSEGMHAQDDQTCLDVAKDIRIVLTEFAERMAMALKDQKTLSDSVGRLTRDKRNSSKSADNE